VDPRILIAIGVAIFVVSMWDLGHLTTSAGEPDVRLALIVRGAGVGFLVTPIINVAYDRLKPSEAQQAAGLINLARQLGGSFGIAILATYLTVHNQYHRVDLLTNVYPGQRLVDERIQALTTNLIAHGYGPDAARHGALALLDQQVSRQAAMLSYNDAWMLLLISFLVVAPAILMLRRHKGGGAMPGGAH
jgi:DHA2 family multidrug resistance protein